MGKVTRTAVSLEPELLAAFDRFIAERGYDNRSEAIRRLIREKLGARELAQPQAPAVGVVALAYSHDELQLPRRLTELQHSHSPAVVSTVHIHLDEHDCLEVVVLRGTSREVSDLGHQLVSHRGVKYGKLFTVGLKGLNR